MGLFFATSTYNAMSIVGMVLAALLSVGAIITGLGYFWSRFVGGHSQQEKDTSAANVRLEQTLKDLLDAQDKKFKVQDEQNRSNLKEIGRLQGVVEEQAKQAKWFEGIMVAALDSFFAANPELAYELNKKMPSGTIANRPKSL